ncbi:flagellar export chaperone FliS [Thermoanaerobacterium thermosaccharolyticum]|uniref:flagellar export chaperone FliS n=1 Tax=Thermoanaerobacterium thermosaccharolyticum TaxID=1517 RepID=UPI00104A17D9|nr:flagellar export chaperone FliS [Thermoanaerobacterium thermosaccharolyticum]KAA5804423.1 flagellar export chaperone FliS [Thermoanaerobacterium thermosaccharolyticum]MBE0067779.1 flagellar export chaperone FliS [Thermoanaerobacterium thermosaccharolyticum]MBE0227342.1 flagellar export chaperone FliS [Thermoanaerobacterium thermosaccharolyticum]TCW42194.1 flagellar protein FliS [Thermohydrogenium kirishiense]
MFDPYLEYKRNSIMTASPEELVMMLYNGIIRFVNEAKQAIDDKNIERAHNSITRAQDIVLELMSTLDMQYDISKNLYSIYDYISRRLIEANLKKDKVALDEVESLISDLKDTWGKAMDKVRAKVYSKG